jgi:hypothetical protein
MVMLLATRMVLMTMVSPMGRLLVECLTAMLLGTGMVLMTMATSMASWMVEC